MVPGTHCLPQLSLSSSVLKSLYPSAQTLLIGCISLNATAREYLPHRTPRGPRKHCPPETTLGPELSTTSLTMIRAPISKKDLPGEDGTHVREKRRRKRRRERRREEEEEEKEERR